jgi:hypothetical protein
MQPKPCELLGCSAVSRKANRRYLMKLWIWPFISAAIAIALLGGPTRGGFEQFSPRAWLLIVSFPLALLGFALLQAKKSTNNMRRALRTPTAEALLNEVERGLKWARMPDLDAFRAQARAFAYALYGDGEGAREALRPVDWAARAPLIQAAGVVSNSLIALLCDGDSEHALAEAKRAQALAALPKRAPGASASNRAYATVLALAQALADKMDDSTLPALEDAAAAQRYPTVQAMGLAGLAARAGHEGTPEQAAASRRALAAFAPKLDELIFGPALDAAP